VPRQNLKSALKLALVGGDGRMGQEIARLAREQGSKIVATMDAKGRWSDHTDEVDVVIDFSQPGGFRKALDHCVKAGLPLVSGTTGLTSADRKKLAKAAQKIPVLYSANMSAGIAVLSAMLEKFRSLGDWDFHVDEVHHNRKVDSPSGTALLLDERLSGVLGRKLPKPNAIRGGGVPGIHQVWAMGPEEIVVLQHTAFNRGVFARGALRAAGWLFDKNQPGLYDLSDLYKS